ncbi:MAG: hypothetical protein A4E74_02361 [Syntrophus sp. PtaB.Bin075]|nr:MAG: hypothetical protein A4E74_02361 [Syntrophus sp. PtaB.Bin075]
MENGDIEFLFQALLDFEAAGRGNVFQIDPSETGGNPFYSLDDFFRIFCIQADGEGVNAAEAFEQYGFPFHDRQRGFRTDIPEPEDGRSVGDDRNGVFSDGQIIGSFDILRNSEGYPRDAGGIGHGQVIAVCHWNFADHLDFPSRVPEKGAVNHIKGSESFQGSDGFQNFPFSVFVRRVNKNFPDNLSIILGRRLHFHDLAAHPANCGHES